MRRRGSADGYESLLKLTRDVALRALELAACQTAQWKKSSKLGRQTQRGGRGRATEGERQVTSSEGFPPFLCLAPYSPSSSSFHPLIMVLEHERAWNIVSSQQIDTGNLITWGSDIALLYDLKTFKQDLCPLKVKFSMT